MAVDVQLTSSYGEKNGGDYGDSHFGGRGAWSEVFGTGEEMRGEELSA